MTSHPLELWLSAARAPLNFCNLTCRAAVATVRLKMQAFMLNVQCDLQIKNREMLQ